MEELISPLIGAFMFAAGWLWIKRTLRWMERYSQDPRNAAECADPLCLAARRPISGYQGSPLWQSAMRIRREQQAADAAGGPLGVESHPIDYGLAYGGYEAATGRTPEPERKPYEPMIDYPDRKGRALPEPPRVAVPQVDRLAPYRDWFAKRPAEKAPSPTDTMSGDRE